MPTGLLAGHPGALARRKGGLGGGEVQRAAPEAPQGPALEGSELSCALLSSSRNTGQCGPHPHGQAGPPPSTSWCLPRPPRTRRACPRPPYSLSSPPQKTWFCCPAPGGGCLQSRSEHVSPSPSRPGRGWHHARVPPTCGSQAGKGPVGVQAGKGAGPQGARRRDSWLWGRSTARSRGSEPPLLGCNGTWQSCHGP